MRKFGEKFSDEDKTKWTQVIDRFYDQSRSVVTIDRDILDLLCS
jgi:hypothetical protein